MPIYDFKHNETGEFTEVFLKLSEYDQYKKDNPELERVFSKPTTIVSEVNKQSGPKAQGAFKEVLSKVKETYTINNIKD